jgi:hypothetical protein
VAVKAQARAPQAEVKIVEKPVVTDKQIARLEKLHGHIIAQVEKVTQTLVAHVAQSRDVLASVVKASQNIQPPRVHGAPVKLELPARTRTMAAPSPHPAEGLTPAKQKILNGLAFLHGIHVQHVDKTQLALIVGVSPTSGGYANNLGALRSAGLIDYPSGGTVALTFEGAEVAQTDGVPTTTDELHEAIRVKLPPAKWKILQELIRVYPDSITKDALAGHIDVSSTSGGFANNLGSLRSLGLISYPSAGHVAATPVLFLDR